MPTLSERSLENLSLVDIRLRGVIEQAIEIVDFSVLEGYRGPDRQDEMFRTGQSKLQWPDSKHNSLPSLAVDIAPYPIDWEDTERFVFLAGVVFTIAIQNGIDLRWGGDWDGDGFMRDETFRDYVHFELLED